MKTLIFSIIFIVIGFTTLIAQNYKSVLNTDTVYFAATGNNSPNSPYPNTLKTIFISSSVQVGSDSIFYFYTSVRPTLQQQCLDTLGPSWLGVSFTRNNMGEETYRNILNQPITIKTLSNLNDSWLILTDSSNMEIWGTITSIDTMTIDNQLDTIKTISLQAYLNQIPQSHAYNDKKIILSKNHGFVATVDFFLFPYGHTYTNGVIYEVENNFYRIDRAYTTRSLTEVNFDKKYQPGNYWQYFESLHHYNGNNSFTRKQYIQDSVLTYTMLSPTCVSVDFYSIIFQNIKNFTPPNNLYELDTLFYKFHTDTICYVSPGVVLRDSIYPETRYNDSSFLNKPLLPSFYFSSIGDSLGMYAVYYNNYNAYSIDTTFWNCVIKFPSVSGQYNLYVQYLENFGIFKTDVFIGNIGGGYISEDKHFYHYFFKIGTDTFGTPLNLKALSVDNLEKQAKISIYPNPNSNGQFYINTIEEIYWEIFSMDGKMLLYSNDKIVDLSSYKKGIYLMKMKKGNKSYYQKLMYY